MSRLRLEASILRARTVRAASALVPWRECWELCRGLEVAIVRCQDRAQKMRAAIIVSIFAVRVQRDRLVLAGGQVRIEDEHQRIYNEEIKQKTHAALR